MPGGTSWAFRPPPPVTCFTPANPAACCHSSHRTGAGSSPHAPRHDFTPVKFSQYTENWFLAAQGKV